jgi:hypothetical protein
MDKRSSEGKWNFGRFRGIFGNIECWEGFYAKTQGLKCNLHKG